MTYVESIATSLQRFREAAGLGKVGAEEKPIVPVGIMRFTLQDTYASFGSEKRERLRLEKVRDNVGAIASFLPSEKIDPLLEKGFLSRRKAEGEFVFDTTSPDLANRLNEVVKTMFDYLQENPAALVRLDEVAAENLMMTGPMVYKALQVAVYDAYAKELEEAKKQGNTEAVGVLAKLQSYSVLALQDLPDKLDHEAYWDNPAMRSVVQRIASHEYSGNTFRDMTSPVARALVRRGLRQFLKEAGEANWDAIHGFISIPTSPYVPRGNIYLGGLTLEANQSLQLHLSNLHDLPLTLAAEGNQHHVSLDELDTLLDVSQNPRITIGLMAPKSHLTVRGGARIEVADCQKNGERPIISVLEVRGRDDLATIIVGSQTSGLPNLDFSQALPRNVLVVLDHGREILRRNPDFDTHWSTYYGEQEKHHVYYVTEKGASIRDLNEGTDDKSTRYDCGYIDLSKANSLEIKSINRPTKDKNNPMRFMVMTADGGHREYAILEAVAVDGDSPGKGKPDRAFLLCEKKGEKNWQVVQIVRESEKTDKIHWDKNFTTITHTVDGKLFEIKIQGRVF